MSRVPSISIAVQEQMNNGTKGSSQLDSAQLRKRRADAKKAIRSGALEEQRRNAHTAGAPVWKILRYSRVVQPEDLPFPVKANGYVTPETFEEHLRYLAKNCRVVSLRDLISLIDDYASIEPGTVALTFDGGHTDTFINAVPLLLRYGMPATFFLPTGFIDSDTFLFEDRLIMALMVLLGNNVQLPRFPFIDKELQEALAKKTRNVSFPTEAMNEFIEAVHYCTPVERYNIQAALVPLAEQLVPFPEYDDFMRWEEVKQLDELGFHFGSMGQYFISHPACSAQEFAEDIGRSFKEMRDRSILPEKIFCFPSGMQSLLRMTALGKLKFRYALIDHSFLEPRFQTSLPMVIGRITMSQSNADNEEVFACRLWQVSFAGNDF